MPAYAVNRTKRLARTRKVYWSDVALGMHLAGLAEPTGAHLENLVLSDLLAWSAASVRPPAVMHWRTVNGEEVDFVIEWPDGALLPVEVKATVQPDYNDARHLRSFRAEYEGQTIGALLLHDGDDVFWLSDGVLATPWWRVI